MNVAEPLMNAVVREEYTTPSQLTFRYTDNPQVNATFTKYVFTIDGNVEDNTIEVNNPQAPVNAIASFNALIPGHQYTLSGNTVAGTGDLSEQSATKTIQITISKYFF